MAGFIGDFDATGCKLKHYSGGAGGIRTLDRALQPYNGLANRRLQPLGHSSIKADMPDVGTSRKQQISDCLVRSRPPTPQSSIKPHCIIKLVSSIYDTHGPNPPR